MERKEEQLSRAISAFSRRQILRLLSNQELTVKEVAKKTGHLWGMDYFTYIDYMDTTQ